MKHQPGEHAPDYLIIGHVTRDLTEDGYRLGGSALYGALLAQRMELKTALFTSCAEKLPAAGLRGVEIFNQHSGTTTTFNNRYFPGGREQTLLDRAPDLDLALLPASWRKAKTIHLAPVAREISLESLPVLPDTPLFFSLQGWLRNWDQDGLVAPAPFPDVELPPRQLAGAFLSLEDLGNDRSKISCLREIFPLLFLTLGSAGAELYRGDQMTPIPTRPVRETDPTGAGDIFAAAFIINHAVLGKPLVDSALLASRLAGLSVARPGTQGVPTITEIKEVQKVH